MFRIRTRMITGVLSLCTAGAVALLGASSAFASSGAATCGGKSSGGTCLYENTGFNPAFGWFGAGVDVSNLSNWHYYNSSHLMSDSVSSLKNLSGCKAYYYANAGYTTPVFLANPNTQQSTMVGTTIGNDTMSSLYWAC